MAGFRKDVKKNVPKVDLQSYNVLVAGGFKSGKTRLWKEVMELHYPNNVDAGLLLAFEDGYNTWEIDSYIDMHNRDWAYFKDVVVKGLVEEAKEGSITKVLGVDTVDRMLDMATDHIVKQMNKKLGTQYATLQEITENVKGENGYMLLKQEVWKQVDTLKRAGYGFFWLAWTKEKETTTIDGLKFNSIELSMSKTGKDIFESQAHLICCLFNEVKVLDKKGEELKENVKNKGKDVASNFHTTETVMYFRPSNYVNIAGGRFTDLPEKVTYSAQNFMDVLESAVEGQLKKTKKTVEELRVEENQQRQERAKEFAQQQEEEDNKPKAEELVAQIAAIVDPLDNTVKKEKIAPIFNNRLGMLTYKKATDVDQLQLALDDIQALGLNS